MTAAREIGVVVAVGIITSMIVIEISMRVCGFFLENRNVSPPPVAGTQYRILCLGDSFVYGIGADEHHSFPAQLADILNTKQSDKTYRVFNEGFPGDTTHRVLEKLQPGIEKVKPQLVILLCGGANLWKAGYVSAIDYFPITDKLLKIAVFRFFTLILGNLHDKICVVPDERYRNFLRYGSEGGDVQATVTTAYGYAAAGEADKAQQLLQEAITAMPLNSCLYEASGILYEYGRQYDEALRCLMKSVEMAPGRQDSLAFDYLYYMAERSDSQELHKRIRDFLTVHIPYAGVTPYHLPDTVDKKKRAIIEGIETDYAEIIRICRKEKVALIMLDYPRAATPANPYLKVIAGRNFVPLVRNDELFTRLLRGADRERFFSDDGHCNARGYLIMARTIAQTMMSEGI